ncbi:MAG: hypothetical protein Q9168_001317 [Polycauliona sp. 1 TL-2023]
MSKLPNAPALKVKLPVVSGSSTASDQNRVKIRTGNFTLVPSGQFMSHVSINAKNPIRTTSPIEAHGKQTPVQSKEPSKSSTDLAVSSKSSNTASEAIPNPVSAKESQLPERAPPAQVPSQASATSVDGDAGRPSDERSDQIDLLGMDFDDSNELPTPMQLSATTHKDRNTSLLPPGSFSLEHFNASITSILPQLRTILSLEKLKSLESIGAVVARRIQRPAGGATQQQSSVPPSGPERQPHERESQPSRGLASAVQQRTLAWGRDVLSGAESGSTSILGENISRWRFSRRRVSVDSLASVGSAGSSTALTERIDQLRIADTRAPNISPATGTTETYASTNPFGPKPTPRGTTSGPQLPAFLRSQDRADDPAAAIQAEYAATFPTRMNPKRPANPPNPSTTRVSPAVPTVEDGNPSQEQRHSQEVETRAKENIFRNSDPRASRNSSISSVGGPKKDFGEDEAQSQRRGSIRAGPRPSDVSNAARSGSTSDGTLPRFHPRLGNQYASPSSGPIPTQTYFPAARRPARAPPGPALPSFLANLQAAEDPGAAAAEQYSKDYGIPPKK